MLFIHILSNPGAETAQSDLVLMSIASGFASRLDFETGGAINWPFVREWTAFASTVVHRATPSEADPAQSAEPIASVMDSLGTVAHIEANTHNLGEGPYLQEVCLLRTMQYSVRTTFLNV